MIEIFTTLAGEVPSGEHYAKMILGYELNDDVPIEVHDLWAVARGVLLYGYFFSPLWVVGDEQLHRVTDAAVEHAYRRFNGPLAGQQAPPLASRIEWLIARRYIDPHWTPRWMAIKDLRNMGSHSTRQRIGTPNGALRSLSVLRDEINQLFASESPQFIGTPNWTPNADQMLQTPKRVAVGDRYELAGQLQSALDHLYAFGAVEHDDNADFTAGRLLIEQVRDRLLGLQQEPHF